MYIYIVHVYTMQYITESVTVCCVPTAGRGTSGKVRVSIRCIDSSGHPSILHTTTFTYTLHDIHGITDWVLRHIDEGLPLQSDVIPSLEDTLELDRVLSEAVQGLKVPLDWRRLLGGREKRREIRARGRRYIVHVCIEN